MRLHHKPFAIRRIAFVPHALAPILWPSDFGPDHRVLLRIDPIRRNHNWLKSLSFFFSQTLRERVPIRGSAWGETDLARMKLSWRDTNRLRRRRSMLDCKIFRF